MTVLNLALKLLLFVAIGFVCRKIKLIPQGFEKQLSRFVLAIPIPCMIINSFNLEFSLEQLLDCPTLLIMSLVSLGLSFLFGHGAYLLSGKSSTGKAARFALMFTNFTFFGLPVVSELYGSQGAFYYAIFSLLIRIVFYGFPPLLLGKKEDRIGVKETLKMSFCPPVIAVFIGLFLYISQLQLPGVIRDVISSFGGMASPMGLMLCGVIIADASWDGLLKHPGVFLVSLFRLLVVPGACLGLYMLLGIEKELTRVMVFCFAMPVASLEPMYYLRYNPDDIEGRNAAGFMVLVSTVASMATIPLWAVIMDKI